MKLDIEAANELRAGAFEMYNAKGYDSDEERRQYAEYTADFMNLIDKVMMKAQETARTEMSELWRFTENMKKISREAAEGKHESES